ncbi:MAG: hypothetical protein AVDCRST_MAG05-2046 [uncultured Rubrobacteraceae bacterium]|uniref:Uncharacterized protein n=1 Tax=uncultured Rubrobacteraceae bacterium TaxID=349277 RepID=A0A6J4SAU7_9ACTN|nr:MAG: hypothetical protein AVDCRST_MAG05-2046 [uncultured Rubrobacteraceae bacterium]
MRAQPTREFGQAPRMTRGSENTQPVELRFHARLGKEPKIGLPLD